jgi:hypothetical protein
MTIQKVVFPSKREHLSPLMYADEVAAGLSVLDIIGTLLDTVLLN